MEKPKDIFDKLMHLPGLRIFESFYKEHKEVLLYLFFGALTFIVSVVTFAIFSVVMEMNELIANTFSWIIAVILAFLTNRKWVFRAPTDTVIEFFSQMLSFGTGRVITLVIEEIILLVFITWLGFSRMVIKIVAQIFVIIINYFISKILIFRENK